MVREDINNLPFDKKVELFETGNVPSVVVSEEIINNIDTSSKSTEKKLALLKSILKCCSKNAELTEKLNEVIARLNETLSVETTNVEINEILDITEEQISTDEIGQQTGRRQGEEGLKN